MSQESCATAGVEHRASQHC